jgi:erythromycin 3''-O-methyltransferase
VARRIPTRANLRHALTLLWQGRNAAAAVYDSIGPDFFLALAPGWLNLGLWEGEGDEDEAPVAVRRLVERLASGLPTGGAILDVGNGLGVQDPVISHVARPASLVALNITESQLRAGRPNLQQAGAHPVAGDATRIPLAGATMDGLISVEAAFHFSSRRRFFDEAARVLRPGGVLAMSDVPIARLPRGPVELAAGLSQLRVWGLRAGAVATASQIESDVHAAGFGHVEVELVGDRVIAPALTCIRRRLDAIGNDVPAWLRLACRAEMAQVDLLWRRGLVDYLLLRAIRGQDRASPHPDRDLATQSG